ncbi:MAG: hypothetical protein AAGP08_19530, partial [Pseudomonadota bacterium]
LKPLRSSLCEVFLFDDSNSAPKLENQCLTVSKFRSVASLDQENWQALFFIEIFGSGGGT